MGSMKAILHLDTLQIPRSATKYIDLHFFNSILDYFYILYIMKNKNEMQIIISRRSISNSDHEFKKEQKYGATDSCIPCAERKINS